MKMHYSHNFSTRRIEQIVGGFIVLPLLGLVVVALFMAKAEHVFDEKYLLTTHLSKSYGLEPGAPVLLAGIPIGKVKAVNLNDAGTIDVLLQMLGRYQDKVRQDSMIAVEKSGLVVGQTQLVVSLGSRDAPSLADGATIKATEPRDIAELVNEVAPVLQSVQRTLLRVEEITKDVQMTVQTGSQAVATVDRAIAELPEVVSSVHRVVGSIEKTAAALPAITGSVQKSIAQLPEVVGSVQRTVGSVERTTAVLPQITAELPSVVAAVQRTVGSVERTAAALPQITGTVERTIASVEKTAQALPEITSSVKNTVKVAEGVAKTTAAASAALPGIVETTKEAANNIRVTTDAMQDLGREMPGLVRTVTMTFKDLNTIIRGAKRTFPVSTFVKNAGLEPEPMPEGGPRSLRGDQLSEK